MTISPAQFEGQAIRRVCDDSTETWWFSVVDVVQVLTQQADYQTARKYWNQLKHRLKLPAADGKRYLTDAATAETLLRIVQTIPSPKAEPIKLWLANYWREHGVQPGQEFAILTNLIHQEWSGLSVQQHKAAAAVGGRIAKQARQQLEQQTGRSVVTGDNYLAPPTAPVLPVDIKINSLKTNTIKR